LVQIGYKSNTPTNLRGGFVFGVLFVGLLLLGVVFLSSFGFGFFVDVVESIDDHNCTELLLIKTFVDVY